MRARDNVIQTFAASRQEGSVDDIRQSVREGRWDSPTAGLALGYVQANVVILPAAAAFDFLLFSVRNPKACPILEVFDVGSPFSKLMAPGADIRTDVPRYCIYRDGELVDETIEISDYWQEDFVTFLLGCGYSTDSLLLAAGVNLRNIDENRREAMFVSNIACATAGRFAGPLVVSMRPLSGEDAIRATVLTSRLPEFHGAPVHIGDPRAIGISDIGAPDYGEPEQLKEGEVPVFWACGVTPQAVAVESKVELMITHSAGHMFITSKKETEYA
jgi:uncharacterized protein YcsI (UPF0317 family)